MKPQKFYDSLMPIMLLIEVLFGFGILSLAIFMGILPFFMISVEEAFSKLLIYLILMFGVAVYWFLGFIMSPFIFDRAFGRLLVYEDRVVYKCFLRKSITIKIEEVAYAGVDDFHRLREGILKIRGDEYSFIYLSKNPYPDEYIGKIILLKNKKGFIKFSYSDKLAQALIDILPAEKDNLIRAFYGKMKSQDMLNKHKKRKNKKN